jgi:hypothetical protein
MIWAMLIGYAFYAFFGDAGDTLFSGFMTPYVKDQVKIAIPDKQRRELALKGLAAVNDDFRDLDEQVSKDVAQLEKLIKNYDSKPEDFDQLFSSVLAKRQQQTDKIWDDRKAMLQHIQPDEWRAILSGARAAAEKKAPKK